MSFGDKNGDHERGAEKRVGERGEGQHFPRVLPHSTVCVPTSALAGGKP